MKAFLDLPRFYKKLIAVAADLVFLPLAFYLAIIMRYEGMTMDLFKQYVWLILAAPAVSIPIFIKLGLYRAVVRFIDHKIVYVVISGVTLAVMIMAALVTMIHHVGLSRGALGIYWVIAILYVVASRFVARSYFLHASFAGTDRPRVAIYGAGQGGTQLLGALRAGQDYLPVAFIDDKAELHGTTIGGIKVFPSTHLAAMVARKKINGVVLAMPSVTKAQQKHIIDRLEPLKLKTWVMPPMENLMSGTSRAQDVREIDIEDLLGRDPVAPDAALISKCITGKTVMVSGAGGSIGGELCRQILKQRPDRLILLELSEFALYSIEQELQGLQKSLRLEIEVLPFLGSVLEQEKCERIMRNFSVETIYHAAAYKHVPLVEHNPIDGIRNNALGTLSLARAAIAAGVKCFVLISTDKAVRPTNVMGSTKRLAELVMQAFARQQKTTRFCMVRFGNVLGSSGSVVPLFRKQIMAGGPITLTHPEITRYFMTIPEAAQLVLQAGAMGDGGDVFVLDMGEPVKIVDMARRMVHLSGLEVKSDESPDGTIEIRHVGLRPGEKLYEELLIGSNVEGTEHPLILRAKEAEIPWGLLQELLGKLEAACARYDHEEVRALLLQIVPGYAPQCGIEDLIWRTKNDLLFLGKATLH
ncbi:polysaccharide biosynthesis protein [Noviherbaspirillum sedimenti]|uniref:Polysaccharide biosynthesis protein n=1 Tax=Noviherbaspirillum sedimenti TaxID=2320865 RepID=A0A3A3G5I5_9BURK|nr:nucleoside-diphosphate sugar epimerase/dehydratase [Noviherbaspirillum sedimenti]RJG03767.1 polysaccharide biosynthesis protein [Noviherbaspirillum sedimenti]